MRSSLVFFASLSVVVGCAQAESSGGVPTVHHEDGGSDVSFDVPPPVDSTIGADSGHPADSGTTTHDSGTAADSGTTTTDSGTTDLDSGTTVIDSGTTTTDSGSTTTDTALPFEGGTSQGGTTGLACTSDSVCDVTADHTQKCSSDVGFSLGTLYPDPVCVGTSCTPGTTSISFCDGTPPHGVCIGSTSGVCLPLCTFDSTRSPSGCVGKDACIVYGWTTSAPVTGIGYCLGGCTSDADCSSGGVCQTETGLCVTSKITYTKSPGTACTSADATAPAKCDCLYNAPPTSNGYCTQFCVAGGSPSCPSGYSCDALLPTSDPTSGATLFTGMPAGVSGYCLKDCTSDTDCTGMNSTCKQSAGVASKTCQPF